MYITVSTRELQQQILFMQHHVNGSYLNNIHNRKIDVFIFKLSHRLKLL